VQHLRWLLTPLLALIPWYVAAHPCDVVHCVEAIVVGVADGDTLTFAAGGVTADREVASTQSLSGNRLRVNFEGSVGLLGFSNGTQVTVTSEAAGAAGAGLQAVASDASLAGDGTAGSPLAVANPFTAADEAKLDGIEAGATGDQSAGEIVTALASLAGDARLSADAIRDLPEGGGGGGGSVALVQIIHRTNVSGGSLAYNGTESNNVIAAFGDYSMLVIGWGDSSINRNFVNIPCLPWFTMSGDRYLNGITIDHAGNIRRLQLNKYSNGMVEITCYGFSFPSGTSVTLWGIP